MKIFLFCFSIVLLMISAGCSESAERQKPSWQEVRISQIFPKDSPAVATKEMNARLGVYYLRIPSDAVPQIQELIGGGSSITVESRRSIVNGFWVYAGSRNDWQKFAELIESAGIKMKSINAVVTEKIPQDMDLAQTTGPVSLFYYSDSSAAAIGFDAGQIALRIRISRMIGLRQKCRLEIVPVYKIADGSGKFVFDSAGTALAIGPDNFVLLAPAQPQQEGTIGSILLGPTQEKIFQNTVGLCLIVCESINYPLER